MPQPLKNTAVKGDTFGTHLTVLKVLRKRAGNGGLRALVVCECGNVKAVAVAKLRSGHTSSCGCAKIDGLVARQLARRWRTDEYKRQYKRAWKHGISLEQFSALWERQGGLCGVCRCDLSGLPAHQVHIDHDHDHCDDGEYSCDECVRGIVCAGCNTRMRMYESGRADLDGSMARKSRRKCIWTADVVRAVENYLANPPAQERKVA